MNFFICPFSKCGSSDEKVKVTFLQGNFKNLLVGIQAFRGFFVSDILKTVR